jgi:hypothetical protein
MTLTINSPRFGQLNRCGEISIAVFGWVRPSCRAYIDEAPIYRALPTFTTSYNASIVSSTGVFVSKR